MNFGNNYNQALLQGTPAPVLYQQMPYTPSYSVPIQSQPAPLPQTPMKVDNYESTRDKNMGDVIGGFFTGAGKAIYDMGHGLFFLGGVAGRALDHPIDTIGSIGGAVVHGVTHPVQTTQMVVTLPFAVAKGIVKPYSQAIQQGKYGEALGRLAVDVTVIAAAMGDKPPANSPPATPAAPLEPPPPVPTPTPVTPPPTVATPVATPGGGNTVANQIKDVLMDQIANSSGMSGSNNSITNNINIVIGGGIQGSTSGGGTLAAQTLANADDLAKVASQVEAVTPAVTNVAPVVNATEVVTPVVQAAETAGTAASTTAGTVAAATSQGSTIGTKIGSGIDIMINAPGKAFTAVGEGVKRFGQGIQNVGNAILHPLDTLQGINPEAIANGIRNGGNALADGLLFTVRNPKQAAIIAGAVGRGGKAAEDILMEMDIVR